jgi:hypothetical protein
MLLNWLRKKRRLSYLPCFTIELGPEGSVLIKASWARPEDPDEFAAIIKRFVSFLMLMKDSRLFPVFQHAISVYGHNHDDEDCAKAILITLQKVMDSNDDSPHEKGEPLVKPTEAFHRV